MTFVEHRAAARIAWRYAWRAKLRTALVLFLIALPIAGLAGAGIMIKSVLRTPEEEATSLFGSADLRVDSIPTASDGSTPIGTADLQRALPAGTTVVQVTEGFASRLVGGSLVELSLRRYSEPADRAPVAAIYSVRRGRVPRAAGEAALPEQTARKLGVSLGDTLTIDRFDLRLHIVGFVVEREALDANVLLIGPGTQLRGPDFYPNWLIDLPPNVSEAQAVASLSRVGNAKTQTSTLGEAPIQGDAGEIGFQSREQAIAQKVQDQRMVSNVTVGLTALALFGTGLIATAALGVGARRQLRALGLVGAGGGEPRHVKAIVIWGGALQGLTGAAIGVLFAVLAAFIAAPHIDGVVNRIVGTVRVPWWAVVGGLILGTLAATIAAIGPARQAAAVTTIDALAGRTPRPQAPGKLARRGGIAVAVGSALVVMATISSEANLLAIALIISISGFLLAIPMLVTWVGRLSPYLPTTLRLAARQTSRYGRRTGAAVAAATLALAAPVAIAVATVSGDARDNNHAIIGEDQMTLATMDPDATDVPQSILDSARNAIPGSTVSLLTYAKFPCGSFTGRDRELCEQSGGGAAVQISGPPVTSRASDGSLVTGEVSAQLVVADANILRAAHGERGIPYLNGNKIIMVGGTLVGGVLKLHVPDVGKSLDKRVKAFPPESTERIVDVPAVAVPTSSGATDVVTPEFYSVVPSFFISPEGAAQYGLKAGRGSQALLRAPHDLSEEEIARVKQAVAKTPGGYAQSKRDYIFDSTAARLLVTAAAVVLALIIVAVAITLAAAESRREHAILSAVGAGPRKRRWLSGANAFLLTALAGVLAVPGGFLPVTLIQMSRNEGYPIIVPWSILGIVAIGAPLIAGAIGILASREPKSHALLQPLW